MSFTLVQLWVHNSIAVLPDIFQKISLFPYVGGRLCRRRNAALVDPASIDVVGVEIAVGGGPTILNSPN